MPSTPTKQSLLPLLDHIALVGLNADGWWQGWHIQRIQGGANNLLYRATGTSDIAIKWTLRDWRDRAGREYAALDALQQAGLAIAPLPVLLDRERYAQPVIVQTWLVGEVTAAPPATEDEWWMLVQHYATVHSLSARSAKVALLPAVLSMSSASAGSQNIQDQLDYIPPSARPSALEALVQRAEQIAFPTWSTPDLRLCRSDPNTLNMVRRTGAWASVDWEYSGWGDPAFEIADIMTHPSYMTVSASRWEWVVSAYSSMCDDKTLATRIEVYHTLLLVWWVARFARVLYEVPLGRDQRLVTRPPNWQAETQAKYEHYMRLAQMAVRRFVEA